MINSDRIVTMNIIRICRYQTRHVLLHFCSLFFPNRKRWRFYWNNFHFHWNEESFVLFAEWPNVDKKQPKDEHAKLRVDDRKLICLPRKSNSPNESRSGWATYVCTYKYVYKFNPKCEWTHSHSTLLLQRSFIRNFNFNLDDSYWKALIQCLCKHYGIRDFVETCVPNVSP